MLYGLCRSFVQTWVRQQLPSDSNGAFMLDLFEQHVEPGLAWVRTHGNEYLPSVDIALVTSVASFLQVMLVQRSCCEWHRFSTSLFVGASTASVLTMC